MGCSSSTQTHTQGSNKPPAKTVETNGPKKSASEVSDHNIDDIETIPDQTKLLSPTENEPSTNGILPEEEQDEAEEAIEYDRVEMSEPPAQDGEQEQAEESTEALIDSVMESEVEEATEANVHEEIGSEEPETKDDETEHPADAAEPEMETAEEE